MTTLDATMGLQETQRYPCPGVPSPWILYSAQKLGASHCSGAVISWWTQSYPCSALGAAAVRGCVAATSVVASQTAPLSWHRRRLRRPWGWGDEVGEAQGVARGDEAASVSDSAALGRSVGPASPPRGRCMACNESSGAIGGHHRAVCAVGAETAQDQTRRLWQF